MSDSWRPDTEGQVGEKGSWQQGFDEGYRLRSKEAVEDKIGLQEKVNTLQYKLLVAMDAITQRDEMIKFLRDVVKRATGQDT